jgi:exopolyphosphatase/guanosine-5'-triphosphate,3'-diphosphate pyrophosphatase
VVARLLGRAPEAAFTVAVRRSDGAPVVIVNAPLLDDGKPMPTRYWLVDPELREAVSRLEAAGGVKEAAAAVDPEELARAHAAYAAERDAALPETHRGPRPSGGVGGTRRGVKCLHAHVAWFLAGGDDPVGAFTAERLGIDRAALVMQPTRVAAVDCGTNSTRLVVVDASGHVLDRQMRITRLGEGVDATGALSGEAIERTLSVLSDYRTRMDELGVSRARLVATSAARDATNAGAFLTGAKEVTGVEPEILSGDEEGRLSFAGATAHLPAGFAEEGPVLVVDIGGGSTELVAGMPGDAPNASALSLDVGCVRVTERFFVHDPPLSEELAAAESAVRRELASARRGLPVLVPGGPVIGLAGTVSTLAALHGGVADYDRDRIHHVVLGADDIGHWLEVLRAEPAAARLRRPGMVAGRQDVILGGVLVLHCVMGEFDRSRCLVSEDDILDGLAASLRPPAP